MRFMIFVKATADSETGKPPEPALRAAMAHYHEQLVQAGVLLDANVLQPSARGWRVQYRHGERQVIDGPFTETREQVAGTTLIQVSSREEALEWSRRFPAPFAEGSACEIEVRQVHELDDVQLGPEAERSRHLPNHEGR